LGSVLVNAFMLFALLAAIYFLGAGNGFRLINGVIVNWLPHDDNQTSRDLAVLSDFLSGV
jgi:hypothetical protein